MTWPYVCVSRTGLPERIRRARGRIAQRGHRARVTLVIDGRATGLRTYRVADAPGVRVVVLSLGLACCAMEIESAIRLGLLVPEATTHAAGERTVMLVSGTVTEPIAPAVTRLPASSHLLRS